jgi:hypothetical protein
MNSDESDCNCCVKINENDGCIKRNMKNFFKCFCCLRKIKVCECCGSDCYCVGPCGIITWYLCCCGSCKTEVEST